MACVSVIPCIPSIPCRGRVNANFWVRYAYKKPRCSQNHESESACSVRKKWDSVSARLKLHTRRTITEDTQVLWQGSAFANNIYLAELIVWWTRWCFWCVIRFSISYRWYAFSNFCTQIFSPTCVWNEIVEVVVPLRNSDQFSFSAIWFRVSEGYSRFGELFLLCNGIFSDHLVVEYVRRLVKFQRNQVLREFACCCCLNGLFKTVYSLWLCMSKAENFGVDTVVW